MRKLIRLFYEMFSIALFVVGGGYAIIAVADETFSRKLKWTKEGELTDQLPLFQMIPGIMAGHAAVYVGRKAAGFVGSCVAVLGVALPSVVIFTLVSMGYDRIPLDNRWLVAAFGGLRAALTGIILAMVVRTWPKSVKGWRGHLGWGLSLAALFVPGMPAIAVILGNLVVFKYLNFLCRTFSFLGLPDPGIALPIGISFYTFQILSYVIDLYRGKIALQRNFFYLLMYVSFFPQLIAGPIVRYETVEQEIRERSVTTDDLAQGFRRFVVGLAKKLLLATSLSIAEVSEQSGYGDYRVFTKVFKKSEGITPSQYRRDFLEDVRKGGA